MKNTINTIIIALVTLYNVNAQSPTDASKNNAAIVVVASANTGLYFAVTNGNWDNAGTWSKTFEGTGGEGVPGANDNVVINHGINVTVNANATCNNLIILSSGTLTCSENNFTVKGSSTISGTFTDNNDKGINTFIGAVKVIQGGVWNTKSVTTASRLIFQNGITHNGAAFLAGAATFITNDQSLAGISPMSFDNNVIISGNIIANNQNTSSITINGALDGIAGNTWKNSPNSTLYYGNALAPMANGSLNVTAIPNTVCYSLNGEQTIKATKYDNIVYTSDNSLLTSSSFIASQITKKESIQADNLISQ
jgi:hypothetical protein